MPAKKKAPEGFKSKDLANNLYEFRIIYIDKEQKAAAEKLSMPPSTLSQMESAKRPINIELLIKLITQYKLNVEWLTTGLGDKQINTLAKPTAATSLSTVNQELLILRKAIAIFEVQVSTAYKHIEKQAGLISNLTERLESLENKS